MLILNFVRNWEGIDKESVIENIYLLSFITNKLSKRKNLFFLLNNNNNRIVQTILKLFFFQDVISCIGYVLRSIKLLIESVNLFKENILLFLQINYLKFTRFSN